MSENPISPFSFLILLITISTLTTPSNSSIDSFIFAGCSQLKFPPNSPFESNLNSLLTSLVNSAQFTLYTNFTISNSDPISALFQCRGDLNSAECTQCVARAVSQLGTLCPNSCGGALQFDGCFVKYDNVKFLGVEDKTVVVNKCGPLIDSDFDSLASRDAVMGFLLGSDWSGKTFRVGVSGRIHGVAQCVGDLSMSECQDCLSEAIARLKTVCGPAAWGDMFLAKCYTRYSGGGDYSPRKKGSTNDDSKNEEELQKTLAILIGLIAAVALLVIFLSCLRKMCEKEKGCK